MTHEMVFFDIDGTLLDNKHQIPESTKQAVQLLQDKGVYTAIATGRSPATFEWVREALNIHSYVSLNGQYVVFEGTTVHENPINAEQLGEVAAFAANAGHAMAFINHHEVAVSAQLHPVVEAGFASVGMAYPPVDSQFFLHSPVHQGNIFLPIADQLSYEEQFPQFRFLRWHEHAVDILPLGVSKAIGIHHLLQAAGIDEQNCMAFGDGLNDVEMLSLVGTGVAMGNAVEEAKQVASYVTTSSSDNGIWNGIKYLGY